jgi:hypothetical protein
MLEGGVSVVLSASHLENMLEHSVFAGVPEGWF